MPPKDTLRQSSGVPSLILASTSTYRAQQFKQLQLPFTIQGADINERTWTADSPQDLAIQLATAKALHVLHKSPGAVVVGADQTACLSGELLHKPGTRARAQQQLRNCSGQIVQFHSAICVANNHRYLTTCTLTEVEFTCLTDRVIDNYLDREDALDCVGSFKCEGLGIALFERITSDDPSALIGLPLIALRKLLQQFRIETL